MARNLRNLLAFVALFGFANSQNCGIPGYTNGSQPITLDAVKETEVPGALLVSLPIFNVSVSSVVTSPHTRYLRVLRYDTRYDFLAADPFPEFVQTERTEVLRRDVYFTCSDGERVSYTFLLPVVDENTEAPVFEAETYSANVTAPEPGSEITVDANILVRDADVNVNNANLALRSSNPRILAKRVLIANETEFVYRFDLVVPDEVDTGDYQIVLTADDGKHSAAALVTLAVLPREASNATIFS